MASALSLSLAASPAAAASDCAPVNAAVNAAVNVAVCLSVSPTLVQASGQVSISVASNAAAQLQVVVTQPDGTAHTAAYDFSSAGTLSQVYPSGSLASTSAGSVSSFSSYPTTTESGTYTVDLETASGALVTSATFQVTSQLSVSVATNAATPSTSVRPGGTFSVTISAYYVVNSAPVTSNTASVVAEAVSVTNSAQYVPITLTRAYPTSPQFTGTVTLPPDASPGQWQVQANFADGFGNAGQGTGTAYVSAVPVPSVVQPDQTFAPVTAPSVGSVNGIPYLGASFQNDLAIPLTGVVWFQVTSSTGQSVEVVATSLSLPPLTYATAYLGLSNLPAGTYTVSVLVWTQAGVPISLPETATVTVS
ncbi:MAG: hypothetical protein RAK18_05480 [Conexivisphaerales archaeon]|nr:hypothetical protein [Conexivisphaerales archaeon]